MTALPTEWHSDRLKDVARINSDSLPAGTNPDYEFDYLEISNVNYYGHIDPAAIQHLRFEDAPSRARRRVGKDATVISSVRPNLQAVAFMPDGRADLICSTGFNVVQTFQPKLFPKFAYYALLSEAGRQYFEATAKGVGYPAVDDKDFSSFQMPLPPLPEQERIAAYLDTSCTTIDQAARVKQAQLDTLDAVRRSIISRAITFGISKQPKLRQVDHDWLKEVPSHWEVCRVKRVLSRMDYGISVSTEEEGR